ncbi:hypothetical protein DER46DRAFT_473683, partial [Fusarium sp. MPI-SDFR-AT-0072]
MLLKHYLALFSLLMGLWAKATTQTVVMNQPEAALSTAEAPSTTSEELATNTAIETVVTTHIIHVGAVGRRFFPNDIKANVGDTLEYWFYPDAHWVIRGDFDHPCVPYESVDTNRTGFSSGPQPVEAITSDAPRFRVRVNDTEPIFYYCGAPGNCVRDYMMGVVNPSKNETLFGWSRKANDVDYQLTPGEHSDHGHGVSAGTVVGIAIGGTVVLALAVGAIYLCGNRGVVGKTSRKSFRNIAVPTFFDG